MKKRLAYGAIAFIWVAVPSFIVTMSTAVVTDIVQGTCVPWGVYSSYAAEKALSTVLVFFTYLPGLLPVSAASPSMDHEHGTVCQPILEHQIRPSAPSSVI